MVYLVDGLVAEEDGGVVWGYEEGSEGALAVGDGAALDVKARFEVRFYLGGSWGCAWREEAGKSGVGSARG